MKQCLRARLCAQEGEETLGGNCLERRVLSNKHSRLIKKSDASWGSLLRLHRGAGRGECVDRNVYERQHVWENKRSRDTETVEEGKSQHYYH